MGRDLRAVADVARASRTDFAMIAAEVIATFEQRQAAIFTMKELHAANRRSVGCFFTAKLIKGDVDQLWHSRT